MRAERAECIEAMLCDTRTDGMPPPTLYDGVGEMGRQGAPLQASLPEGGGTGLPVTEGVGFLPYGK